MSGGCGININVSDNQIQFSGENFDLISRLIDGRYPDYQKIIPEKFLSKAVYDKKELEKNIKLTGLFASNINDIKMTINKDISNLLAKHTDKGEIVLNIKNQLINEPFNISLNYLYLLDGLKNINSEKVILEYTGEGNPLILKPEDKDIKYTYLIMPLKN